jgi:hypothetical protein
MKLKKWGQGLISSKSTALLDFGSRTYIFFSFHLWRASSNPRAGKKMIMETFSKNRRMVWVFLFLASCIVSRAITVEGTPNTLTNCDIQLGPCTKVKDTLTVTLDIFPKPVKAMKELTFRLTFDGRELPDNPYIDLGMPGMAMGPNRVLMKRVGNNTSRVGNNTYEGQGVIVRCPSGQRTWKASVILPDAGAIDFVFDVIY